MASISTSMRIVSKYNKTGSYSKRHNSLKARPWGLAFYYKIRIIS